MPIDNRIVESRVPFFVADVGWDAGVRHAGWQAGKRFGTAQAHRELEYLQRVEEFECCGLAADNLEGERGARAGAPSLEQIAGRESFRPLVGFAGVSMKIIATRPLLMASSAAILTAASSTPSAKPTAPIDRPASVLAKRVSVPP
jgi:hypothetical protein